MKKRLLITSIVMMLVVAVALSTATYAWFTTSTNVSATAVVLTASTMNGDAILISHSIKGTGASNAIALGSTSDKLYPATPLANTAFTTGLAGAYTVMNATEGDAAAKAAAFAAAFEAQFQNLIMDGTGTYVAPTTTGQNPQKTANDVSFYKDTFYIFNKGFQSTTIVPTVNISYDPADNRSVMAAKSVRVAIVERVGTQSAMNGTTDTEASDAVTFAGNYLLKGIWQFGGYVKVATDATFDNTKTYYTVSGGVFTEETVADATAFGNKKANLYVASDAIAAADYTEVANNAEFSSTAYYYTRGGEGTEQSPYTYTKAELTSSTFAAAKEAGNLYTSNRQTNLAEKGANATYGVTGSGPYTQGGVTFVDAVSNFSAIGVASSGNHIANEYSVIVWLEGWDADCTNAITTGVFSIDLGFAAGR